MRIAAESEPASGSVIAIAAHLPPKRFSCSSLATAEIAAWPSPWRGIVSSRPTSPQHSSITPSRLAMLEPLRLPSSVLAPPLSEEPPPTAPAPAPPSAPLSFIPSISAASMSSSFGYSCSARSYLRELGRKISFATCCDWLTSGANFLGISRLISDPHPASDEQRSLHHAGRTQIAVVALDGMLLDVAVAAEHLDGVGADRHPALGAQPPGDVTSRSNSSPWSTREAARSVASRMPSSSIAMFATVNATACRLETGSPNALRSLTYGIT